VCETWSVTLRVENKFRMFKNEVVLRGVYGPTRKIVIG
jgi:hypothetical protein